MDEVDEQDKKLKKKKRPDAAPSVRQTEDFQISRGARKEGLDSGGATSGGKKKGDAQRCEGKLMVNAEGLARAGHHVPISIAGEVSPEELLHHCLENE